MIELKKKDDSNDTFFIYVDGEICNDSYAYGEGRYEIRSYTDSNRIITKKIEDFPVFNSMFLHNLYEWIDFEHYFYFSSVVNKHSKKTNEFITYFEFVPKLENWNKNFTFAEFFSVFQHNWINENKTIKIEWVTQDEVFIHIKFKESIINTSIKDFIFPLGNTIKRTFLKTISTLNLNKNNNSINTTFRFPDNLRVPCEQYLLYFAQFLQDLGVNATPNLKEEAGKVLFSVTPIDDIEALDKVREALAIYLNLPSSPIVYDDSFAAMRLKQQIDLLKHSQQMAETEFRLRMAQSLVEAQNITIKDQSEMLIQQSVFIQQQKEHIEKITNPAVMMNSVENKEELVELYDGLKIGESKFLKEQLGIHLNPAKVIKKATNNLFGKEEKISILDLDEETDKK
jgi:hypothetical protein